MLTHEEYERLAREVAEGDTKVDRLWEKFLDVWRENRFLLQQNTGLQRRAEELMGRGSEMLNELRSWKLRFEAADKLLRAVLYEDPLEGVIRRLTADGEVRRMTLKGVAEVAKRADALEKDAWCQVAGVSRNFVTAAERLLLDSSRPISEGERAFLEIWVGRFKAALG